MGEGFVKLFSAILDSSVWDYDTETRIVWITLIAMADADGRVHAAVPGIAGRARVTIEDAESALAIFQAPDKYSRSSEYEGRRIEKIGRDWLILNFKEHRARQSHEAEKARKRKWWRENRGKNTGLDAKLDESSKGSTKTRPIAEAEAYTDPEKSKKEKTIKKKKFAYPADFEDWYSGYPWKTGKVATLKEWTAAKKNGGLPNLETMKVKLKAQVGSHEWTKDGGRWVPKPKNYLKDGCYDDEIRTQQQKSDHPSEAELNRMTPSERLYWKNKIFLDKEMQNADDEPENSSANIIDI